VPHTATSGTGQSNLESGKLFDSKILEKGKEFSVPAADLGAGEHTCHCAIHAYMTGKVTVQQARAHPLRLVNSAWTKICYVALKG
jgi:plastocyanin